MGKNTKFVPPKAYPQSPDVITMSKGMVHFIIEGFIRQVIAEMRKDVPEPLLDIRPDYETLAKQIAYKNVIGYMDKVKYNYREMKYIKGKDIKVEFTDET